MGSGGYPQKKESFFWAQAPIKANYFSFRPTKRMTEGIEEEGWTEQEQGDGFLGLYACIWGLRQGATKKENHFLVLVLPFGRGRFLLRS